jgi:hypothetical protein
MRSYRCVQIVLLCSGLCAIPFAASASELWHCSFTSRSGSAKGILGTAQIEIDGESLKWEVLFPSVPLDPSAGTKLVTFQNRVLENNAVGLVAISSQARLDADVGALIGSTVITVNKGTGKLRMGSVMDNGVHDLLQGSCKLNGLK